MNKILVTGGYGTVGSAIDFDGVIKVGRKDADLRSAYQVNRLFKEHKPDYVIHCAGKVGGVKANMEQGGEFYRDNILISTNVIEACRKFKVKKILNFASTCIFPDAVEYPLTVEQIYNGPPHSSNAPYAYAKRMAMVQLDAYAKQYGMKYSTIIPCNIYGPNDNYNLNDSHVIPALIRKCWEAKQNGDTFEIWGNGNPLREFVYSGDISRIVKKMLDKHEGTMIASSDEEISIADVAKMITVLMDFNEKIKFDTTKPNGQLRKPSNNIPCKEFLGDFKFTDIQEGLRLTIEDFIKRQKDGTLRE
jgi:GDP-L-fucose synthase